MHICRLLDIFMPLEIMNEKRDQNQFHGLAIIHCLQ